MRALQCMYLYILLIELSTRKQYIYVICTLCHHYMYASNGGQVDLLQHIQTNLGIMQLRLYFMFVHVKFVHWPVENGRLPSRSVYSVGNCILSFTHIALFRQF